MSNGLVKFFVTEVVFNQSDGFVVHTLLHCVSVSSFRFVRVCSTSQRFFLRILDWILDWLSDILTGSAVAD